MRRLPLLQQMERHGRPGDVHRVRSGSTVPKLAPLQRRAHAPRIDEAATATPMAPS
jgi:hypothetical protein